MAEPGELGNLTLAAENARAVWGWNWLESIAQDFRYGLRTLLRHRRVTFVALLSLALGIGANTLVFSFVNILLLRPWPYPEPERLVLAAFISQNRPGQTAGLTRGNCVTLSGRTDIFDHFGCYTDPVSASFGEDDGVTFPERILGRQLTAGAAEALNTRPMLGRWFTEADEREGTERVLLIGFALWQRRYGGSPDVLGKRVRFNGETATIIGVMPDDFEFLDLVSDYWVPFQSPAYGTDSPARILGGMARLRSEIGLASAQSAMDALAVQIAEESPEANRGWGIALRPLTRLDEQSMSSEARNPLLTLQGSVTFVLLIACANVAGLLLAQGTTQHREMAVRAALGSGRWRIFRQLLVHSMLLSLAGGVAGVAVGLVGTRVLTTILPAGNPRILYQANLDSTVLLFTLGISALSGLFVGLVPALQISHTHPMDAMRESSSHATSGRSRQRLRSAFVAGQIALALILLVGAGLLLNSLFALAAEPLGFDPNNLMTAEVQLPEGKFRRPTSTVLASGALEMAIDPQMYLISEQIRRNLTAIPGVTAATGIGINPPFGGAMNMPFRIEGTRISELQRAQFLPILPGYFGTLQVRVVQGREFTPQDKGGSPPVAVINRAMAQRYWPNESPIGKHLTIDTTLLPNQPVREIVGIVEEVMQYPGQQSRPQLYVPYLQLPPQHDERLSNVLRRLTFIVRIPHPSSSAVSAIQTAVSLADTGQAVSNIRSMRDTAYHSLERRRVYVGVLGAFGIIAVLLAAVGVYGVMAQVVSDRTNEIGIRIALGADRGRVRSLMIRQGGRLVGIGLLFGLLGSLALTRVIRSSLFGVSASDPLTFALATGLLGGIALLACYLPARRASRIDPMLALRHE